MEIWMYFPVEACFDALMDCISVCSATTAAATTPSVPKFSLTLFSNGVLLPIHIKCRGFTHKLYPLSWLSGLQGMHMLMQEWWRLGRLKECSHFWTVKVFFFCSEFCSSVCWVAIGVMVFLYLYTIPLSGMPQGNIGANAFLTRLLLIYFVELIGFIEIVGFDFKVHDFMFSMAFGVSACRVTYCLILSRRYEKQTIVGRVVLCW